MSSTPRRRKSTSASSSSSTTSTGNIAARAASPVAARGRKSAAVVSAETETSSSRTATVASPAPLPPTNAAPNTVAGGILIAPGVIDNERGNWQKWRVRTITTLAMLAGFIVLIMIGHIALFGLVVFVQTMMFREIVNLGKRVSRERMAPEQDKLQWYWFIISMIVMNSRSLEKHFIDVPLVMKVLPSSFQYHSIICFGLYMAGLIKFVVTLRKGLMRYQFVQFAWCHLTLVVVVFTSHFAIVNLFQGLIWMILPSLLIISNDVFAYVFGFFFGRRWIQQGLIELSPKKTWEGFIGATIVTFFFGFTLSRLFASFQMFVCPKLDFTFGAAECEVASHFLPQSYALPSVVRTVAGWIPGLAGVQTIGIAPIQWHGMVFAAFASMIAPFGGFFASGFKRAFKIKDFGDSIPGHGGMTDRMDCQILLGFFVNLYFDAFITGEGPFKLARTLLRATPAAIVAAFEKLSAVERVEVLNRLQTLVPKAV